ncbi:hypothetical protein Vafri_18616 [Volvox africanus]|uniref:Uncharacterized protein n=1 Tax=Volvox africanus TaxID=51714 RepID=A0A8J4F7T6_9CHLO|nr:hypothetical protein Vafri_18616 [Volvox africanus]
MLEEGIFVRVDDPSGIHQCILVRIYRCRGGEVPQRHRSRRFCGNRRSRAAEVAQAVHRRGSLISYRTSTYLLGSGAKGQYYLPYPLTVSMGGFDGPCDAQRQRQLEEQVQTLRAEVFALEAKLGELHVTDISSLRRAYKSLAQHVQALDVETKHLPSLVERATEPSVNSDFVAQQIRVVAAVTAGAYGVARLLRALRVPVRCHSIPRSQSQMIAG